MRGPQPRGCRLENLLTNPVDVSSDGIVIEADDFETPTNQIFRPCDVVETTLMLLPVELNDERRFHAREIGNIAADRMLPTKLQATELSTAQPPPKILLDVDGGASHLAGAFPEKRADPLVRHGATTLNRLPLWEKVSFGSAERRMRGA